MVATHPSCQNRKSLSLDVGLSFSQTPDVYDHVLMCGAATGRGSTKQWRGNGLLMPNVSDPDLIPFEPPDHPTLRAAFRNVIESYPHALYDEEGLVRYRTRFLDSVLVSEPELIHDILVTRADLFRRDDVARQLLLPMVGPTSLLMAEGADWKWQRRAAAPTFRHDKLLALVPTFSAIAVRQVKRWRAAPSEGPVDVAEAMAQTTFEMIVDTVLGGAGALDPQEFARTLTTELDSFPWRLILATFRAPSWLPYPGRRRAARAREYIHHEAARLVAQRRQVPSARVDLLDLLLHARDEETGRVMSDERQPRAARV
jgi:cytochrome P450